MAMENDTTKPINEALIALHIRENGHVPAWNLSEKAQMYFDAVKDIFPNWKNADCDTPAGFVEIEKLADQIIAKWNETKEKEQEQDNGNSGKSGNDKQDKQDKTGEQDSQNERGGNDNSQDGQNKQDNGNSSENKQDKQSGNDKQQDGQENGKNDSGNSEKQDGKSEGQNEESEGQDGQENGSDDKQEGKSGKNSKDSKENAENGKSGKSGEKSNDDAVEKENSKSNSNKKGNGGHGESNAKHDLNDDFANEDAMEQEIRKEMEKIMEESKEFNGNYRAYTSEDTFIHCKENKERFEKALNLVRGKIARLSGAMEQSLKSMSRNRNLNNRENGNLNMRALHVIAKNLSNSIFYKTVKGISLDTTVTLLIDESGSTSNLTSQFMALSIAISEVLDRLGIKFEVLGHSTSYGAEKNFTDEERKFFTRKNPILFLEHKRFNDNYRKEKYRLGSMSSYCNNVDGEVLLEAFKRANEHRASRHIILVLSDGEPSGTRYNAGCENLVKAVNFCRKNGTEVYAFGIGTDEPGKFYGKDNFIYIENVKNLSENFIRQFSEVITKGKMVK